MSTSALYKSTFAEVPAKQDTRAVLEGSIYPVYIVPHQRHLQMIKVLNSLVIGLLVTLDRCKT